MKTLKTFTIFILILSVSHIYAQPVTLDPTFGQNGMTIIPEATEVKLIEFDKQGNIIAVGTTKDGNKHYVTIVKTNADGIIDQNFGNNGIVTVAEYEINTTAKFGLKITNSNKIFIIVSFLLSEQSGFTTIFMQFNENGSFDETFGDNGKIIYSNYMETSNIFSINTEIDDFIFFSGRANSYEFIFKCNHYGELDENFGENGKTYLTDGETYKLLPRTIKILNDQSILVAGADILDLDEIELALCKLTPNGNLATGFANNGMWKMNIWDDNNLWSEYEYFTDAIEDGNGKLFLLGTVNNFYPFNAPKFVCSFHSDGTINNDFGANGFYYYETNSHDGSRPSAQKILQNGSKYIATFNNIRIVSILSNGILDTDFNNTGEFVCDKYGFYDIKLQGRDKLILGGAYMFNPYYTHDHKFALARLNIPSDVSVKQNFNIDNSITIFPNPVKDYLYFDVESKFEIIDIFGKIVLKSEKATQSANVSHLKARIYFIKFENNQGKKFVKQ